MGQDEMRELVKIPVFPKKNAISLSGTPRIRGAIVRDASESLASSPKNWLIYQYC
jgi:hypothetical protein